MWNRTSTASASGPPLFQGKRGPKPDQQTHDRVAVILRKFGQDWTADDKLVEICEQLDAEHVPVPKTWPTRNPPARSWQRGLQNDAGLVIKALKYYQQAAGVK